MIIVIIMIIIVIIIQLMMYSAQFLGGMRVFVNVFGRYVNRRQRHRTNNVMKIVVFWYRLCCSVCLPIEIDLIYYQKTRLIKTLTSVCVIFLFFK